MVPNTCTLRKADIVWQGKALPNTANRILSKGAGEAPIRVHTVANSEFGDSRADGFDGPCAVLSGSVGELRQQMWSSCPRAIRAKPLIRIARIHARSLNLDQDLHQWHILSFNERKASEATR